MSCDFTPRKVAGRTTFFNLWIHVLRLLQAHPHEGVAEDLHDFLIAAIGAYSLLGHGWSGTRLVKGEEIRLMPVAGFAAMKACSVEGRAIQAIRCRAGFDLVREVRDTLQNTGG